MRDINGIHHVRFVKMRRQWVAQIFVDSDTCVSWQTVGTKRNVDRIIKKQLGPLFIQALVETSQ